MLWMSDRDVGLDSDSYVVRLFIKNNNTEINVTFHYVQYVTAHAKMSHLSANPITSYEP